MLWYEPRSIPNLTKTQESMCNSAWATSSSDQAPKSPKNSVPKQARWDDFRNPLANPGIESGSFIAELGWVGLGWGWQVMNPILS